jgi:UDP-4-amino-4,6-dideoxy-N-acetyl-beta-L-altrosamine transaminase
MIPYGRQSIDAGDVDAVREVLNSDWLTQGPTVPRFEAELTRHTGAAHAVAVSSATAALHLACRALGLGPGELLWTAANTFVASANCARYCGADVDFIDIDPRTYNISCEALADKLRAAERSGRLPKIVMPVHFAGQSCQMRELRQLAERYGFRIIEDASHAIGADYLQRPVGSCQYADLCVFSFHPVKIITTAEGGAVMTNQPQLAERLRLLRSHGISREPNSWRHPDGTGPWYYEQHELGYNYRLTDLQAALGCSQMRRLDEFVARRRALAESYDGALRHPRLLTPWQHPDARSCYHLYPVRVATAGASDRNAVFAQLRAAGVGVNVHYIPVCAHPYYQQLGFSADYCPNAWAYYREAISLPLFPALSGADQQQVVNALLGALG